MLAFSSFLSELAGLNGDWILVAVAVSSAQFVINIRLVVWQISGFPVKYGIFQILISSVAACGSVYLISRLGLKEDGRILSLAASTFIFSLISMLTLYKGGWIRWKWDRKLFNEAIAFGVPLIPHVLGTILMLMADRFIISKQLGLESVGVYFVAVQLALPITMLADSYNRAFKPWLFEKLSQGEDEIAVVVSYISMALFLVVGVVYSLVIYFIYPMLIGTQYAAGQYIAVILILANTFQALYYTVANYIFYDGRTSIMSALTMVNGFTYVLTGWFVVAAFGLIGLPILATITGLCFFLCTWTVSNRINQKPWFSGARLKIKFRGMVNSIR